MGIYPVPIKPLPITFVHKIHCAIILFDHAIKLFRLNLSFISESIEVLQAGTSKRVNPCKNEQTNEKIFFNQNKGCGKLLKFFV